MTLVWLGWAGLVCYKLAGWWRGRPSAEDRGRARSEAAMAAAHHDALKPAEEQFAVDVHAFAVEWHATGEQPFVPQVKRKPRSIVRRYPLQRQAARERVLAGFATARAEFRADPLTAPIPTLDRATPMLLDLAEPEPWRLESFTTGWTRGQLAQILSAGAPK
jgi:hypothetical protein